MAESKPKAKVKKPPALKIDASEATDVAPGTPEPNTEVDTTESTTVRLVAPRGTIFRPFGDDLPEITSAGTEVTPSQAEEILSQSRRSRAGVRAK